MGVTSSLDPDDYALWDLRAVADAFMLDVDSWSLGVMMHTPPLSVAAVHNAVAHRVKAAVSARDLKEAEAEGPAERAAAVRTLLTFSRGDRFHTSVRSTLQLRAIAERAGLRREVVDGFEKTAILQILQLAEHTSQPVSLFKIVRVAERMGLEVPKPVERGDVWDALFKELATRRAGSAKRKRTARHVAPEGVNTPPSPNGTEEKCEEPELSEAADDINVRGFSPQQLGPLMRLGRALRVRCIYGGGCWDRRTKELFLSDVVAALLHRRFHPVPYPGPVTATPVPVPTSLHRWMPEPGRPLAERAVCAGSPRDKPMCMPLRDLRKIARLHFVRDDIGGYERRTKQDIVDDVNAVRSEGFDPTTTAVCDGAMDASPVDQLLQLSGFRPWVVTAADTPLLKADCPCMPVLFALALFLCVHVDCGSVTGTQADLVRRANELLEDLPCISTSHESHTNCIAQVLRSPGLLRHVETTGGRTVVSSDFPLRELKIFSLMLLALSDVRGAGYPEQKRQELVDDVNAALAGRPELETLQDLADELPLRVPLETVGREQLLQEMVAVMAPRALNHLSWHWGVAWETGTFVAIAYRRTMENAADPPFFVTADAMIRMARDLGSINHGTPECITDVWLTLLDWVYPVDYSSRRRAGLVVAGGGGNNPPAFRVPSWVVTLTAIIGMVAFCLWAVDLWDVAWSLLLDYPWLHRLPDTAAWIQMPLWV